MKTNNIDNSGEKFVEKRNFRPNQNLIYHLIKSQNSTPVSAIKELIQNSFDAVAKKITLDFSKDKESGKDILIIADDGKGFADRNEIETFFEEFGKVHEEDNSRKFGRFRMGRCQIMAFAKTEWRSGNFKMVVDIKKDGLSYDLIETKDFQGGCSILCHFYNKEWWADNDTHGYNPDRLEEFYKEYLEDIVKSVKYFHHCDILINSSKANVIDPWLEKKFEDDIFIFYERKQDPTKHFFQNNKPTEIYNLGAFVREIYFHISGVIVTKQHLSLDITRRNILANCILYKHIQKTLKKEFPQYKILSKGRNFSLSNNRINLICDLFYYTNLDISLDENPYINHLLQVFNGIGNFWNEKIFSNINNTKRFSFEDLSKKKFTFCLDENKNYISDRMEQRGIYIVLNGSELLSGYNEWQQRIGKDRKYDIDPYSIFFDLSICLERTFNRELIFINSVRNNIVIYKLAEAIISENDSEDTEIMIDYEDKCLSKKEKALLKTIRTLHSQIVSYMFRSRRINHKFLHTISERQILAGESLNNVAWTDGEKFIAFDRKSMLKSVGYKSQMNNILLTLFHEYCHNSNDNMHDASFYRNYHDLVCLTPEILGKAQSIFKYAYSYYCSTYNLKIPKYIEIDSMVRDENTNLKHSSSSLEKITLSFIEKDLNLQVFNLKHLIENPLCPFLDFFEDNTPFKNILKNGLDSQVGFIDGLMYPHYNQVELKLLKPIILYLHTHWDKFPDFLQKHEALLYEYDHEWMSPKKNLKTKKLLKSLSIKAYLD